MMKLRDIVHKIRSKNAGPFWVTVDLFCESTAQYEAIKGQLDIKAVANLVQISPVSIKRFDLDDLKVVKISFPRPIVQGHTLDRDQHGAQFAHLLGALPLTDST